MRRSDEMSELDGAMLLPVEVCRAAPGGGMQGVR